MHLLEVTGKKVKPVMTSLLVLWQLTLCKSWRTLKTHTPKQPSGIVVHSSLNIPLTGRKMWGFSLLYNQIIIIPKGEGLHSFGDTFSVCSLKPVFFSSAVTGLAQLNLRPCSETISDSSRLTLSSLWPFVFWTCKWLPPNWKSGIQECGKIHIWRGLWKSVAFEV